MNILEARKIPLDYTNGQRESLLAIEQIINDMVAHNVQIQYDSDSYPKFKADYRNVTYVLAGYAGTGKLQPYTSKIVTPEGIVTMSDIVKGSEVISKQGKVTKVLDVYPQKDLQIYKVTFEDGSVVECCIDHLWQVQNNKQRQTGKYSILTTKQLIDNGLKVSDKLGYRYSVDLCEPVEHTIKYQSIDPYTLGYILGNGSSNDRGVTLTMDVNDYNDIAKNIVEMTNKHTVAPDYAPTIAKIQIGVMIIPKMIELNLHCVHAHNKFIPDNYKYSDISDRLALLQGLMDSDGNISIYGNKKKIRFSSVSKQLCEDIIEVVQSLGGIASLSEQDRTEEGKSVEYSVSIRMKQNCFRLTRKKDMFDSVDWTFKFRKKIVSIDYVGLKDGQCILVDNDEHLYLTDSYTVTHNTTIAENILNYARFKRIDIIVLAPTNKAVNVLRTKLPKDIGVSTLHASLYGSPDDSEGTEWTLSTKLNKTLLLVDESSMVDVQLDNDIKEAVEFGSIIIYMGDNYQLEPVGKDPHIFDRPGYQLTEVKRQADDSPILKMATIIRCMDKIYCYEENERDILFLYRNRTALLAEYVHYVRNSRDTIFIVDTNKERTAINKYVRRELGYVDDVVEGERLMSIANSSRFANGETFVMGRIKSITPINFDLPDYHKKIKITALFVIAWMDNVEVPFFIVMDYDKPSLYHQVLTKFMKDDKSDESKLRKVLGVFGQKPKKAKDGWQPMQPFKKETNTDIEFSKRITICTYGYAVSCHKSQGSQWEDVFVNQTWNTPKWNIARWFYTAITRASKTLHLSSANEAINFKPNKQMNGQYMKLTK